MTATTEGAQFPNRLADERAAAGFEADAFAHRCDIEPRWYAHGDQCRGSLLTMDELHGVMPRS